MVVVARSSYTFEGWFLHEGCEVDGRILIHGNRWLSMIALRPAGQTPEHNSFPVDEVLLRKKLSHLTAIVDTTPTTSTPASAISDRWIAVFGKLESPAPLKPHIQSRKIPGNGYGANGSVPARILIISSKNLGVAQ